MFDKYFPVSIAALFLAIILHEVAHGLVAYACGDDTAKVAGRLTLNPFKHLDIFGLISLAIFKFGWANPVPVDTRKLRNYNVGMFLVSIAGVTMNFLMAFITSIILKNVVIKSQILGNFLLYFLVYNLNLAFFNLIPLPPLDGSNIILSFFSPYTAYEVQKYSRYSQLLLLVLIFTGTVSKYLGAAIVPVVNWMIR